MVSTSPADAMQLNTMDIVTTVACFVAHQNFSNKIFIHSNLLCLRIFSFLGGNRQNYNSDEK